MLSSLWLPTILATAGLFFASFLSWMVLPIHFKDWVKLDKEDDFMKAVDELGIGQGSYMFPGWDTPEEMKSEEYAKKWEAGPVGVVTLLPQSQHAQKPRADISIFPGHQFLSGLFGDVGPRARRRISSSISFRGDGWIYDVPCGNRTTLHLVP